MKPSASVPIWWMVGVCLCICWVIAPEGMTLPASGGESLPAKALSADSVLPPAAIPTAISRPPPGPWDGGNPRDGDPRSGCKGDVDNNGVIDGNDIQCFVDCFLGTPGSLCNCVNADMDGSGAVNTADLNAFVPVVLAGVCDPCQGAAWSNGPPDGTVALLATRGAGQDAWVIDDMVVTGNTNLNGLVFHVAHSVNFHWTGTIDLIVVLDNAGIPGTTFVQLLDVPATRRNTGVSFGFLGPIWEYQADISPAVFVWPGAWWVGMRPVQVAPVFGAFWTGTAATVGLEAYVLNPTGGIPAWTPSSQAYGHVATSMSFCMLGVPGTAPLGACCWMNTQGAPTCQNNLTQQQCYSQAGSQWQWHGGQLCANLDPICGGGACCLSNGTCQSRLEDACYLQGGTFLGVGVACDPNPCIGACCVSSPQPACIAARTEAQCAALSGSWHQAVGCSPNPCLGACCDPITQTCADTYQLPCLQVGRDFMGEGTACADPCTCPYQRPPNDDCAAVNIVPLVPGTPLIFSGDNSCATTVGCTTIGAAVWHAFSTSELCTNVTIDYCASPAAPATVFVVLYTGCPCVTAIQNTIIDWQACPGAPNHPAITWQNLPAGNYYYPVYSNPLDGTIGPYTITVNGVSGIPPANDMCANRVPISGAGSWLWDSTCATRETGHPNGTCVTSGTGPDADVWFLWTAQATGTTCISLCDGTSFDTVLAVYDTTDCAAVSTTNQVACSDDDCGPAGGPGRVQITVPTVGHQYLIRIGGWNGTSGPGKLTITSGTCPPIVGIDICAGAEPILCGGSRLVQLGQMGRSTDDPLVPCYYSGPDQAGNSAWLLFTATATSVRVQTCNSPIPPGTAPLDTQITLWPGTCGAWGTAIACSEDDCGSAPNPGWLSTFCATGLTVGHTYLIEITSFAGGGNAFDALVEVSCPCTP